MRSFVIVVALAFVASSCAVLPSADKVKDFGDSAGTTATAVKAAIDTHYSIALRIGEEQQADNLLTGQIFTLDDAPDTTLETERLQVRLKAVGALKAYSTALAEAADKKTIAELEAASAALGSAVQAAAAVASPLSAPVVGPAVKLASRIVGLGLGHAYAVEIQAIVSRRDPDVARLAQLLKADMQIVADHLRVQRISFREHRRVTLARIAKDRRVDDLRLYDEYRRARSEVVAINALSRAADQLPRILDDMAAAHHALATGAGDARAALQQFANAADDIAALLAAVTAK